MHAALTFFEVARSRESRSDGKHKPRSSVRGNGSGASVAPEPWTCVHGCHMSCLRHSKVQLHDEHFGPGCRVPTQFTQYVWHGNNIPLPELTPCSVNRPRSCQRMWNSAQSRGQSVLNCQCLPELAESACRIPVSTRQTLARRQWWCPVQDSPSCADTDRRALPTSAVQLDGRMLHSPADDE